MYHRNNNHISSINKIKEKNLSSKIKSIIESSAKGSENLLFSHRFLHSLITLSLHLCLSLSLTTLSFSLSLGEIIIKISWFWVHKISRIIKEERNDEMATDCCHGMNSHYPHHLRDTCLRLFGSYPPALLRYLPGATLQRGPTHPLPRLPPPPTTVPRSGNTAHAPH